MPRKGSVDGEGLLAGLGIQGDSHEKISDRDAARTYGRDGRVKEALKDNMEFEMFPDWFRVVIHREDTVKYL